MTEALLGRLRADLLTAQMLLNVGVRLDSVATYPLRRRWSEPRLEFCDGTCIVAPRGEPLLHLVREIWVENRYPVPAIGAGDVIVDIGAHVGSFAIWASARCPGVRIVSVEPSPVAAGYLRRNVAENHLDNVTVVEAACAADDSKRTLFSRGVLAMNTLFADNVTGDATTVRCVTIDQLFERFQIDRCAFLKLDCEGAEYQIIFSASNRVLSCIDTIAMEYHRALAPHDERAMASFLAEHGFTVRVGALEDHEGGYLYANRISAAPLGGE